MSGFAEGFANGLVQGVVDGGAPTFADGIQDARRALVELRGTERAMREARWVATVPARFTEARLEDVESAVQAPLGEWTDGPPGRNLVLMGPVGTGKTYAAVAAVRQRFDAGASVEFHHVARLLERLRPNGDADEAALCAADVLVLDDLGGERPTDWTRERLDLVVNERWSEARDTIVTTNLPIATLREVLDERLYSRLLGAATVLRLSGRDRRQR